MPSFSRLEGNQNDPGEHPQPRPRIAVEKANEKLTSSGDVPLPEGLTPHKLRHTYASILVALGVDLGSVIDQLGHTDPGFTLRVYRHGMRRHLTARQRLRTLVGYQPPPVCASCPPPDLPLPGALNLSLPWR